MTHVQTKTVALLICACALFITSPCTTSAQECVELEQCLANARNGHSYDKLCEVHSGKWNSKCGIKSAMADNCEKYMKGPNCNPESFSKGMGWSKQFYTGSSYNSESQYVDPSYFIAGLACGQGYCGHLSAFSIPRPICHERVPNGAKIIPDTIQLSIVTDHHHGYINTKFCPAGYAVSQIKCQGRMCDDLRLRCTNVGRCTLTGSTIHSNFFSEEVRGSSKGGHMCGPGQVLVGIHCNGGYCDNIRMYCRYLSPPRMTDQVTEPKTLRSAGLPNECVVRKPTGNLAMSACSSTSALLGFTHGWQLRLADGQCMTLGMKSGGGNVYSATWCDVDAPEHKWKYEGPGSLIRSVAKPEWCLQVALAAPYNLMAAPCDIRVTKQQWNFV